MNEVASISKADNLETREAMKTPAQLEVSKMQEALSQLPQIDCPLVHRFTPGLYAREILMLKDTFIVSKIHGTEHPFVILKGSASVWIEGVGVKKLTAPYVGITKPGTRRILYIHDDCSWITFHPTDKKTVEEVEAEVIYNPGSEMCEISEEVIKQLQSNEATEVEKV